MTGKNKQFGIKSWSEEDRPREKLMAKGPLALTNSELFAILISTGSKERTAVDLAKELLSSSSDSLEHLSRLSVSQIMKIKGIGKAKAITIAAALEIGRRRKEEGPSKNTKIISSKDAYDHIYPFLADMSQETFFVILLKRSNQVITQKQISLGGVSGTLVDPKLIFKYAIDELASSIILCHNHPSGNIKPSQADINITRKIREGAKILDISLLDHIIFTNNAYFSFADEALL